MDRPSHEHTFTRADVDRLVAALHRQNDIAYEMESEAHRAYFTKVSPVQIVTRGMLDRIRLVTGAPARRVDGESIDRLFVDYGGCVFCEFIYKED